MWRLEPITGYDEKKNMLHWNFYIKFIFVESNSCSNFVCVLACQPGGIPPPMNVEDGQKPNTHTHTRRQQPDFFHFSVSKSLSDKNTFHPKSFICASNQRRIKQPHQYSTMERNQKFQFTNKSLRTNENRQQKKQFELSIGWAVEQPAAYLNRLAQFNDRDRRRFI